jgi:flagellar export protein FliJ
VRPFVFRAAAALRIRQQQEDEAGARLARAEADLQAIDGQWRRACAVRDQARGARAAAERDGTSPAAYDWHRNWNTHVAARADRLQLDRGAQVRVVADLVQAWRQARRRRLVLERLRDRALSRHRHAEAQREQRATDELARLRHAIPGFVLGGGSDRDD